MNMTALFAVTESGMKNCIEKNRMKLKNRVE